MFHMRLRLEWCSQAGLGPGSGPGHAARIRRRVLPWACSSPSNRQAFHPAPAHGGRPMPHVRAAHRPGHRPQDRGAGSASSTRRRWPRRRPEAEAATQQKIAAAAAAQRSSAPAAGGAPLRKARRYPGEAGAGRAGQGGSGRADRRAEGGAAGGDREARGRAPGRRCRARRRTCSARRTAPCSPRMPRC